MTEQFNIDEALSDLTDEKKLSDRRKKAEDEYKDFTSDQIDYLRRRCKNDLFFLARGPLQYNLMSPKLHGNLSRWIERTRSEQYRMILLPRGHYKSTIATISDSVQMALPNVGDVAVDHPYTNGENVKILLAHENKESASRFLYEIIAAFMSKPAMLALFPECIPTKKQRLNKNELEIPRSAHHKEPTFDTIGANGAAQGRHYDHIKLDDIIGAAARDSQTIMARTIAWFDNVNSLLTRLKHDGFDLIGTRWGASDVYSHAMKTYGIRMEKSVLRAMFQQDIERIPEGMLAVYARGAIENGEPVFSEEFSMEQFNILRKSPIVWAAQYANNPRDSGLNEFQTNWLRYYTFSGNGREILFGGGQYKQRVAIRDLDICVMIDPSMGSTSTADHSGIVVTGTDRKHNIFVLETVKKRLKPPELIDEMIRLWTVWRPRVISIESVAFSAVYKYWFQERCAELNIQPNIQEYKPGSKRSKEARIRGLTHFFSAGQVWFQEGMTDLIDEYEWFPFGDGEHLLDALAQGPEGVWQKGNDSKTIQSHREAEMKLLESRSVLTGY